MRPGALHYWRTAEASLLLLAARSLIACVPFRYWRKSLGKSSHGSGTCGAPDVRVFACRNALDRAALRQKGAHCLPRAMAMHWMLSRRGLASGLTIGALPSRMRDRSAPLHAWTEHRGIILTGRDEGHHLPIGQFVID